MRAVFIEVLEAVWKARISWFWPIWVTMTVLVAICVAWIVRQAATSTVRDASKAPIDLTRARPHSWSRGALVALALLGLFLASYIVLILKWEDFTYYDNQMFTLVTLRGRDLDPSIGRGSGRFFPFGHQEFNLIRHFTSSAAGYHAFPIGELLVFSCILVALGDELSLTARAGLTALVLLTPGMLTNFSGLIYDERNVVFWLAGMLFSVKRFDQIQSTAWAVAAALCAQVMIYYKEVAFLLLWGFVLGRLFLRCRNDGKPGWNWNRLQDRESRLDMCLASLGVLFLLYYAAVMLPHPNVQYAAEHRLSMAGLLLAYIKLDLLAWLFVFVVVGRGYLILRRRVAPSLFWDPLALGGVAYFAAYLGLRIYSAYYLAPADVIAVLYLGRCAILSWPQMHASARVASLALLAAIAFQCVSLSAFRLYERKNLVRARSEMARVVQARYQSSGGTAQRLFFPFAKPSVIMQFAAYLNYRGIPVEEVSPETLAPNNLVLVGSAVPEDGPCILHAEFLCHSGTASDPGDLVIVMPDDEASLTEVAPYRDRGELLFSYEPRPRIPQWLRPFLDRLRIASPHFAFKELPDRWLQASVTLWK